MIKMLSYQIAIRARKGILLLVTNAFCRKLKTNALEIQQSYIVFLAFKTKFYIIIVAIIDV